MTSKKTLLMHFLTLISIVCHVLSDQQTAIVVILVNDKQQGKQTAKQTSDSKANREADIWLVAKRSLIYILYQFFVSFCFKIWSMQWLTRRNQYANLTWTVQNAIFDRNQIFCVVSLIQSEYDSSSGVTETWQIPAMGAGLQRQMMKFFYGKPFRK